MAKIIQWAKIVSTLCGGWATLMSGPLSVAFVLVGLFWPSSPRLLFAALAYASLLWFAIGTAWKNYQLMYPKTNLLDIEALPLKEPFDTMTCKCALLIKNQNTNAVNHIGLKLIGIEPPLKSKTASISTDKLELFAIKFSPKDFENDTLEAGTTGRFDIFLLKRSALEISLEFSGRIPNGGGWVEWMSDFVPEIAGNEGMRLVFREYIMEFQTVGRGVPPNTTRFRLAFSTDRNKPAFELVKI